MVYLKGEIKRWKKNIYIYIIINRICMNMCRYTETERKWNLIKLLVEARNQVEITFQSL